MGVIPAGSSLRKDRLDGGGLDDDRFGPFGIVADPLGPHDGEMRAIRLLLKARRGIGLGRVFQYFAIVTQNADSGIGVRLHGLKNEVLAGSAIPVRYLC